MGGRGSSGGGSGGGGGTPKHGQTATVNHPLYGKVRGTVHNPEGNNAFTMHNAKAVSGVFKGTNIPKNTIFTGGSLSNNPHSGF